MFYLWKLEYFQTKPDWVISVLIHCKNPAVCQIDEFYWIKGEIGFPRLQYSAVTKIILLSLPVTLVLVASNIGITKYIIITKVQSAP